MPRLRVTLCALPVLVASLAAAQEPAPQPTPSPEPTPPPKPATFRAGSWGFTTGGRIKLDVIHDFDPIGSTDSFDPRTIPTDGSDGTNTRITARETRLSLGIEGPVEGRDLLMYVEGDFAGSSSAFRLRHAYGRYSFLTAGQTWSTFMDEDNIPNTIDFETPLAAPLVRQGLVRFTFRPSGRTILAFGVEEADPEVIPPPGVSGKTEKPWPDLTSRFKFTHGRGHVQLSGFIGKTRFRPTGEEPDDVTIGGVLASVRYRPFERDAAYAEFAWGPGLGRYRGGVSAAPDPAGQLQAVEAAALTVGYEHYWSPRWSSNVVWSPAWARDDDLGDPDAFADRLDYFAANLIYWFLEKRAWVGVEYLHGVRELKSGAEGSANRVQFAVRWNIPG